MELLLVNVPRIRRFGTIRVSIVMSRTAVTAWRPIFVQNVWIPFNTLKKIISADAHKILHSTWMTTPAMNVKLIFVLSAWKLPSATLAWEILSLLWLRIAKMKI